MVWKYYINKKNISHPVTAKVLDTENKSIIYVALPRSIEIYTIQICRTKWKRNMCIYEAKQILPLNIIHSQAKKLFLHMFDIVDSALSYERELIVCSFLKSTFLNEFCAGIRTTDKVTQKNYNKAKKNNNNDSYKMAAKDSRHKIFHQKWEKPLSRRNNSIKFGS